MSVLESLARRIPNSLRPPLRSLYRAYAFLYREYMLRHYSAPVRKVLRFFFSHSEELEAQMSAWFAAELLQAVVNTDRLQGDIIECGTYRGGSTVLVAQVLDRIGSGKQVYACDTFEGHPYDDIDSAVDYHRAGRGSDTSVSYVRSKFERFGVKSRIAIAKGRFEDILLRELGDKEFSLAFLDCDLYDSAKVAYSFLYTRVVPGGCIVVHDYVETGGERIFGISAATDEFLCEKGLVIKRVGSCAHVIWIPQLKDGQSGLPKIKADTK